MTRSRGRLSLNVILPYGSLDSRPGRGGHCLSRRPGESATSAQAWIDMG